MMAPANDCNLRYDNLAEYESTIRLLPAREDSNGAITWELTDTPIGAES